MIERIHNTNNGDLTLNQLFKYGRETTVGSQKPNGIWYGLDDDWIQWCYYNMPHWIKPHFYKLDIDDTKILKLKSRVDIDDFSMQYKKILFDCIECIDWLEVKKHYDGIEIQDYSRGDWLSFKQTWYYSWDCSSGCIWNIDAIKGFELVNNYKDWYVRGQKASEDDND